MFIFPEHVACSSFGSIEFNSQSRGLTSERDITFKLVFFTPP